MSDLIKKRLYIGGLSTGVSEEEISERFARFGKVSNLSMKSRQDEQGNCLKVFAHLDIEGEDENIKKCFNTYQNTKWKGSVLKLQYAKESFLTRLEEERKAEEKNVKENSPALEKKSGGEWKEPELPKLTGPAVPGTPIPGKKDWVVGKYGRVLPILNVKKSYKIRAVKHDPSKFCHAAKVFKDESIDTSSVMACDNLTWEMDVPDSEITKKRKGEFPPSPKKKKPKNASTIKSVNSLSSDTFTSLPQGIKSVYEEAFEIVGIGHTKESSAKELAPSRFDSDYEDDTELVKPKYSHSNSVNSPSVSNRHLNIKIKNEISKIPAVKPNELLNASKTVNSSIDYKSISPDEKRASLSPFKQRTSIKPQSDWSENSRRKVPEFAGIGMLMALSSGKSLQSDNKNIVPVSSHDKLEDKQKNSELASKREEILGTTCTGAVVRSPKRDTIFVADSTSKEATDSTGQSTDRKMPIKNKSKFPDPKDTESKKLTKRKIKNSDSSIFVPEKENSNSETGTVEFVDSFKSSKEADGNDSVSSADTDEIIANYKNKPKAHSPVIDIKEISGNKSVLNQSIDLSEFSASAPEILSNSMGNSTRLNASIASDSYDSDLDSNDFELVAKKLAQKASKSTPTFANRIQQKSSVMEHLSASKKDSTQKPLTAAKTKENSASQSAVSKLNTKSKLNGTKGEDSAVTKPSFLHSKLLEIAGSKIKKNDKKASLKDPSITKQNKHVADNEKRLKALQEQKKIKEQQQHIVKTALENVDSACTKRIVFSSSEDDSDDERMNLNSLSNKTVQSPMKKSEEKKESKTSSPKLKLLDDSSSSDESDYEEMFKSKPQFEGKKGEKLMEMQRKIGDSRFQMDEKFIESEDSGDEEEKSIGAKTEEERSFADEKKMNLDVLENVVGRTKMEQFTAKLKKKTKHIIDMNAIRFDPTKMKSPSHEALQQKENLSVNKERQTKASSSPASEKAKNPEGKKEEKTKKKQMPAKSSVSMSSSLVDMLKDQVKEEEGKTAVVKSSFSLLQQFDEDKDSSESHDEEKTKDEVPLSGLFKPKAAESPMETVKMENSDEDSDEEEEETEESSEPEIESHSEEEISEEETTSSVLPNKSSHLDEDGSESSSHEKEDDEDGENDELRSITALHDPLKEKEEILLSAGRTDIRFSKEDWLDRWDEIRSDLMKICRRKHKDAGKSKRVMDEKKRKKDILRNVKRRPWMKR